MSLKNIVRLLLSGGNVAFALEATLWVNIEIKHFWYETAAIYDCINFISRYMLSIVIFATLP